MATFSIFYGDVATSRNVAGNQCTKLKDVNKKEGTIIIHPLILFGLTISQNNCTAATADLI